MATPESYLLIAIIAALGLRGVIAIAIVTIPNLKEEELSFLGYLNFLL
jgi:hypothetical protein